MSLDLKGKVVVITGAGGVICSTLAKSLAVTGAKIALLDLNVDAAKVVADEIVANGYIAKAYKVNVLDKTSIEDAHAAIKVDLGECNILINGAGGNNPKATTDNEYCAFEKDVEKDFFDLKEEGVKFVFDLNFIGTFLPTQVFAKDMVGKKGCSILNISSMNAFTPLTKIPAYSGAKAAVSNFTAWLAVHFSKVGIRVNAIAPGFFVTNQNRGLLFDQDGNPTDRTKKILASTPMDRFGEIDELVGATHFLLDEKAASFITGVVLPIDGGFNAFSGV
ncbi:MAG: SDR family oxidoreductase [Christensenellales bacterium]|jgi:NAD(P)-dependent dehydrogenase (short-subunit alcohol dehydrogenase family)|nr:SDR family oxidoreductase [Clostridiales bacterium]